MTERFRKGCGDGDSNAVLLSAKTPSTGESRPCHNVMQPHRILLILKSVGVFGSHKAKTQNDKVFAEHRAVRCRERLGGVLKYYEREAA